MDRRQSRFAAPLRIVGNAAHYTVPATTLAAAIAAARTTTSIAAARTTATLAATIAAALAAHRVVA